MTGNADDHAVVIGIRRYADTAAGWIDDLNGPENNVAAVSAWMTSDVGGRLPAANVRVVSSRTAPDPFVNGGVPDQSEVVGAFQGIAALPKGPYQGQWAGRRLYVYVSGHGWAQRRGDAALVTAEATVATPCNVLVSGWFDWITNAALFQEVVLWVDTCAVRDALGLLTPCTPPGKMSGNQPFVKVFMAFAAQLGLMAGEAEMPDGRWHGAFTYTLMQGLGGAAAGAVTSASLQDYLRSAMKGFMSPEQQANAAFGHEPAFGTVDPMEFAPLLTPEFGVTLILPAGCAGQAAEIVTTRSAPPVRTTPAVGAGARWAVELEAGHYAVHVPGTGLTAPFTVLGGGADGDVHLSR